MELSIIDKAGALLGRALLAAIFIWSGSGKIFAFAATSAAMAGKGIPISDLFLVGTITVELLGGLMLLSGWQARWAALALFLFIIPTTLIFHPFWNFAPPDQRLQQIQFFKNLAIMGGMLTVFVHGPGPWSLGRTPVVERPGLDRR